KTSTTGEKLSASEFLKVFHARTWRRKDTCSSWSRVKTRKFATAIPTRVSEPGLRRPCIETLRRLRLDVPRTLQQREHGESCENRRLRFCKGIKNGRVAAPNVAMGLQKFCIMKILAFCLAS